MSADTCASAAVDGPGEAIVIIGQRTGSAAAGTAGVVGSEAKKSVSFDMGLPRRRVERGGELAELRGVAVRVLHRGYGLLEVQRKRCVVEPRSDRYLHGARHVEPLRDRLRLAHAEVFSDVRRLDL